MSRNVQLEKEAHTCFLPVSKRWFQHTPWRLLFLSVLLQCLQDEIAVLELVEEDLIQNI